eukprot:6512872-Alexandrium_andersonii.AAC.1
MVRPRFALAAPVRCVSVSWLPLQWTPATARARCAVAAPWRCASVARRTTTAACSSSTNSISTAITYISRSTTCVHRAPAARRARCALPAPRLRARCGLAAPRRRADVARATSEM